MNLRLHRWLSALPPQLQPRGVRYHAASSSKTALLEGKRVFVLPTRQGFVFMAVLMVMLIGATNYSNSMAFALTFLLGSMLIVSLFHTYRNLTGIELRLAKTEDCFVGGHAQFILHLHNPQQRPRYDIQLKCPHGISTHLNIDANDHNDVTLSIAASTRGAISLGRITPYTTYPFGLFRAWSYVDIEGQALVYPHPSETTPPNNQRTNAGEGEQTLEPGSDDFYGFRDYQVGDSPRHINWKAAAREQGLITKQFQRQQSPELWFDWLDTQGNDIEERLSHLCRWVLDADNHKQRYGLRLPGIEIEPGQGPQQRRKCLRQLALFGHTP